MLTRHRQTGMTMIGWLILLAILGFFALAGLRLMPAYLEYMSVVSAVGGVAEESTLDSTPGQIRESIRRRFVVNDVSTINERDIQIKRDDGEMFLVVDYEARRPLIANIEALVVFNRRFEVRGRAIE